jgi:hypothetical protein
MTSFARNRATGGRSIVAAKEPCRCVTTAWEFLLHAWSVPAVATDYFEVRFFTSADTSMTIGQAATFQIVATHFDGVA